MGNSINFNVAYEKNLVFYIKCEKADTGGFKMCMVLFPSSKSSEIKVEVNI